jgi:Ca2+-binding RTX toxin-like protein
MATPKNVVGTKENDTLKNTAEIEVISGGEGIDTVVFEEGKRGVNVNMKTGVVVDSFGNRETMSGVEIVIGTSFADTITGSDNADVIVGGGGNDKLSGGNGHDELYGEDGDDSLVGGNGADTLIGGKGNDTLSGGNGFDLADYSGEDGGGITVDLIKGTAIDNWGGADKLVSIEHIRATDYADKITGSNANNLLEGGGGDDVILAMAGADAVWGGFGKDTIDGGTGNDTLTGGHGDDQMDGGTGVDTLDYSHDGGWRGVSVDMSTGFAEDTWASLDTFKNMENVTGSNFGDWIRGDSKANVIDGRGGDDTLIGNGGKDTFVFAAGHGNDRINDFGLDDKLDLRGLGVTSLDQVLAMAQGHDLGAVLMTGEGSSIVLVDVNIADIAKLSYIFA